MRKCSACGGRLKRVHRTMWERIHFMAVYECRDCHSQTQIQRRFRYHLGMDCRCPKCGTQRLTKLRGRDPIDPMCDGFLNLVERLAGGKLYHCRYCRVQFYDRRELKPAESDGTEPGETSGSSSRPLPDGRGSAGPPGSAGWNGMRPTAPGRSPAAAGDGCPTSAVSE